MKKKKKKISSKDDSHVIFIDRLTDFHIQKDKKKEEKKGQKKND